MTPISSSLSQRSIAQPMAIAALSLLASGCVGLGSHIEGSFSCRAPKGDCAPSHVIDAQATAELDHQQAPALEAARQRAGVAASDASRTAERTIRVVFPAHVDEAGVLHDEAVAWAVVERPQWAGTLRAQDQGQVSSMRAMRRKLRQAQASRGAPGPDDPAEAGHALHQGDLAPDTMTDTGIDAPSGPTDVADLPADLLQSQDASPFQLAQPRNASPQFASPLPLPSPVAEATSGAPAPEAGGSGSTSSSQDRIPRHFSDALRYPTSEAIEAAKVQRAKTQVPKANRGHGATASSSAPRNDEAAPSAVQSNPGAKR